jgi:hypothetical protein
MILLQKIRARMLRATLLLSNFLLLHLLVSHNLFPSCFSVFQNTSLLSLGLFLLSLSSLLPLAFLPVFSALPWPLSYVIPFLWPYLAYKARERPFFTRSCLTIVRNEHLCFFEKKKG